MRPLWIKWPQRAKCELGCDVITVKAERRLRRCDALWERGSQRVRVDQVHACDFDRGVFFSSPPEAVGLGRRKQKWTENKRTANLAAMTAASNMTQNLGR